MVEIITQVTSIFGPTGGLKPGHRDIDFKDLGIHRNSTVLASISEIDEQGLPVLRKASMHILNISPEEGLVHIRVKNDGDGGDDPIPFRVNILTVNFADR